MLLLPVFDELALGQEHRHQLSVADSGQADTAESSSPSASPEGLHEAANNSVRKAWNGGIPLNDRNKEGVGVCSQEQMKEIFRQGVVAVV
jgi:hypothetical protein